MSGSDAIVIATILFLLLSAVVLVLMLFTMRSKKQMHIPPTPPSSPSLYDSPMPQMSSLPVNLKKKSGIHLTKPAGIDLNKKSVSGNTKSLDDIQDFIEAKAEILYNGNVYAIDSDNYQIGRDKSCNLVIPEMGVSRAHCMICYKDNKFTLSDSLSTNGTYINGEKVKFNESMELNDGDEIRMGYAVMTFKRRNERKANDNSAENPSQRTE